MLTKKTAQILLACAGVLTVAGAVMQIVGVTFASYVFTIGSLVIIYLHLQGVVAASYTDKDLMRRLLRMGFIACSALVIACCLMFLGSNSWVAFLLIYAVTELYLTFRTR